MNTPLTPIYLGFNDMEHMAAEFFGYSIAGWHEPAEEAKLKAEAAEAMKGVEILLASYHVDFYDGDAFVLFRRDGKLYEVNASHCSCYGLEDQWEPEETSIEALRHRMDKGTLGSDFDGGFAPQLKAILDALEASS